MQQTIIKPGIILSAALVLVVSCKKFDDLNSNPKDANEEQVKVEYFINNSILNAQMDPHIAERVFVLYWKTAGRQQYGGGLSSGAATDEWSVDYYRYISEWLNHINTAIQIADEKIPASANKEYLENLKLVSRIWRAYLMSEMCDNFGPIPLNGFQGTNPEFSDVRSVYYFLLDELKDASAKINTSLQATEDSKKYDMAYGFTFLKWKKYANSMRLRLAMRLSEVDASKAKAEFEAAAGGELITSMDDAFQVQENDQGWNALNGVMSREWNAQLLSTTLENLYTGLGGVKSEDQLAASYQGYIKPANWAGLRLTNHFSTMTNEPYAGYWFDGLPYAVDPRAYKAFILPGDFDNPDFSKFPSYDEASWKTTKRNLMNGNNVVKELDGAFTWNGANAGAWGDKGTNNQWRGWPGAAPRVAQKFRNSKNKRIFFAPWETYFLLAEGAVRNWNTPMSGKAAYELGIRASFDYWGVGSFAGAYLASTDFNRAGTSVSWDHITEPPADHTMNYKDGYTNTAGTVTIKYPVNTIYKNGSVRNDQLTKIITQKFIAQVPWLPMESWNDHRRLGLPFQENPNVEIPLASLPDLNAGNYMTNSIKFFPQRLAYPSSLKNTNPKGYEQAVKMLGGADQVLTPLWWAKH